MKVFQWLKNFFLKSMELLLPVAKEIIFGKIKGIALEAVRELQSTDLNNEDKRKEAFKRIKSYAIGNGIDVKDSLINLALEFAVVTLKKEF